MKQNDQRRERVDNEYWRVATILLRSEAPGEEIELKSLSEQQAWHSNDSELA